MVKVVDSPENLPPPYGGRGYGVREPELASRGAPPACARLRACVASVLFTSLLFEFNSTNRTAQAVKRTPQEVQRLSKVNCQACDLPYLVV